MDATSASPQRQQQHDEDLPARLEGQENPQPVPDDLALRVVELARRAALKTNGVDGFAGLDVWPYGKPIRDADGRDDSIFAKLWEKIYGHDTQPLFEHGHFALAIHPWMQSLVSDTQLTRAKRFINPAIRISRTESLECLVLTVEDGAIWNEYTLETFLMAWELMVGWYRQMVKEFYKDGEVTHCRSIDEAFSVDHCRYKKLHAQELKDQFDD